MMDKKDKENKMKTTKILCILSAYYASATQFSVESIPLQSVQALTSSISDTQTLHTSEGSAPATTASRATASTTEISSAMQRSIEAANAGYIELRQRPILPIEKDVEQITRLILKFVSDQCPKISKPWNSLRMTLERLKTDPIQHAHARPHLVFDEEGVPAAFAWVGYWGTMDHVDPLVCYGYEATYPKIMEALRMHFFAQSPKVYISTYGSNVAQLEALGWKIDKTDQVDSSSAKAASGDIETIIGSGYVWTTDFMANPEASKRTFMIYEQAQDESSKA